MSNTLTSIDITHNPELKRIAEKVTKSGVSLVLREDNHDVALLTPVGKTAKNVPHEKGFLALAGKLKGIIDTESVIATIYKARSEGSRQPTRP
jgi:hypothetical protein